MSASRAARVEQKIVEVPKNKVVVTFGQLKAAFIGKVDLENDSAIKKQGKK